MVTFKDPAEEPELRQSNDTEPARENAQRQPDLSRRGFGALKRMTSITRFRGFKGYALLTLLLTFGVWAGCEYTVSGNPDVNLVEVTLSPRSAYVTTGGTLDLTAAIHGTMSNGALSWSISGDTAADLVTNGLTATYTAPQSVANGGIRVVITVSSNEDASKTAQCTINVIPPPAIDSSEKINVILNPLTATIETMRTLQFRATVLGDNSGVIYSVLQGPGSITQDGLYMAPATVVDSNALVVIQAASRADTNRVAQSSITLVNDSLKCFGVDVQPILVANCGMSGCHGSGSSAHGLIVTEYQSVLRSVRPGNARGSSLYRSITEINQNDRMPPPPHQSLGAHDVRVIGQWIDEGALECQ